MPVYEVAAIYTPNGNRRSRPIVADDADHAKAIAEVDWEIAENDPQFTWDIYCRPDEDGRMERLLRDAEAAGAASRLARASLALAAASGLARASLALAAASAAGSSLAPEQDIRRAARMSVMCFMREVRSRWGSPGSG